MSLYARDPSRQLALHRGGSKAVLPPVAMVWRCLLSVDEYVRGRRVVVPRPECPRCEEPIVPVRLWAPRAPGWAGRRIWVRRVACALPSKPCATAVVPVGAPPGRGRDIGAVIETVVDGAVGSGGGEVDVPYTTARGWLRRFSARASMLAAGFAALAVGVGVEAGIDAPASGVSGRAVGALRLVVAGIGALSPSLWVLASLGHRRQVVGHCHGPTVDGPRRPSFDASSPLRGRTERQTTWMTTWPRRSRYTAGR